MDVAAVRSARAVTTRYTTQFYMTDRSCFRRTLLPQRRHERRQAVGPVPEGQSADGIAGDHDFNPAVFHSSSLGGIRDDRPRVAETLARDLARPEAGSQQNTPHRSRAPGGQIFGCRTVGVPLYDNSQTR